MTSLDDELNRILKSLSGVMAYSLAEAATALGVSEATVRRLVKKGKLKTICGLKKPTISRQQLETFINNNDN